MRALGDEFHRGSGKTKSLGSGECQPGDASLKWALPHANSGFKATPRLPKSRVDPQVLALTSAGVVKLWEIWGHQERPKPAAEATPEELPLNYLCPWSDE